jgi:DNA invertase Pin-like site-specific DNA recombinase
MESVAPSSTGDLEVESSSFSTGSLGSRPDPARVGAGRLTQLTTNDCGPPTCPVSTPAKRPERRRRRAKEDRGLPPDEELAKLAIFYLERQRKLWPQFVAAGLLPEPTLEVINEMVASFKERHRRGEVDVTPLLPFVTRRINLGGAYSRYSCDSSSPSSITDQLANELDKSHSEGRFIPWAYVFADYSVTGLDATRQGYSSYKKVLAATTCLIETTYIDDFTRASRDEIEWWLLAALSKRLSKRMIGASDGFSLSDPNWDMHVTMFGLLSRLFIKGLREKVKRGMKGAAERGTCLGKLALGFTKRARVDTSGTIVVGADGLPIYEPCICPETREHRLLIYTLFIDQKWSAYRIARHFNRLQVDGWNGWTESTIKKLLSNPNSIGVFIWNKTHRELDYETKKYVVVRNPRSEWKVYYNPSLAIAPIETYCAARRELARLRRASSITGKKPTRNENSATTLFSGTLYCQHCKAELKLIRSTTKYKQLGCLNGTHGAHECRLSGSKSTRIIEETLLGFLRDQLLTQPRMAELIAKAKEYVAEEAKKPQVDTAPLKTKLRKLEIKRDKLISKVEETDDAELSKAYHQRVLVLQKEINQVNAEISEANTRNRKKAAPLDEAAASGYLADLRGSLGRDVAAAAEAIRQLTGPIMIRQDPISGKRRGGRWIATFSPTLVRLLQRLKGNNFTVDALAQVDEPQPVEIVIDKSPKYETLAPKFRELKKKGASIESIASAHKMSYGYAEAILHFGMTGERPVWKRGKKTGSGAGAAKYLHIKEQVVQLRDKKRSIKKIAKELNVSEQTVRRAYDDARPEAVKEAAENGERPRRGSYSHLGEDKLQEIRTRLAAGEKPPAVAKQVGCGSSTVYRIKDQMKQEPGGAAGG